MKSGRNILLSIYKLLFALIVLCYHGLTPFDVGEVFFCNGACAVCFFFLCIGYYMYGNMERFIARNGKFTAVKYAVRRVRRFGIPFYICAAADLIIYIANYPDTGSIFHYLWFIAFTVEFEFAAVILVKHLKKRWITLIMLVFIIIASVLKFLEWGGVTGAMPNELLGFISIPLGYFLALGREKIRSTKKALIPLALITPAAIYLLVFPAGALSAALLIYIITPGLLLLILMADLLSQNSFAEGLISGLSLWIYIYQEIPRVLSEVWEAPAHRGFYLVCILTLLTALFRTADHYCRKKEIKIS